MAKNALWTRLHDIRLTREIMLLVHPDNGRARIKLDGCEFLLSMSDLNEMIAMLEWVKKAVEEKE